MKSRLASLVAVSALAVSFAVGCSTATDESASASSDITSIPESTVKDQGDTGNCWIYSTLGWIESLAANPVSGETKDLSPAYINYWQWYDQITDPGDTTASRTTVDYGGSWGQAVELIARYGVMRLGKFVRDDAAASLAAQQALDTALTSGELTTFEARQDRARVRAVLDRAWGLAPATQSLLTTAFGADGTKTFDADAHKKSVVVNDVTIKRPADITMRTAYKGGNFAISGSLSALIGTRTPGDNPGLRDGLFAWSAAVFDPATADAAARRAFLRRIQTALHDGVPLPFSWSVAWRHYHQANNAFVGALEPNGYVIEGADPQTSIGGHATLLDDYEATNVPGFGTLKAGVPATDAQKEAALGDDVHISFLRVKNSWGTALATKVPGKPPKIWPSSTRAGYFDLDTAYLLSATTASWGGSPYTMDGLLEVVLPKGY